ncbi:unnamed protein product [Cuscuta epithymum]|uniref:Uncharacterized protein n=1 Tax=Cuscuta epithymum TaxID=186058 RepID=A0AAV0D6F1_9ASTE|nr:unnamed protein product [Cuscuta epithymum]
MRAASKPPIQNKVMAGVQRRTGGLIGKGRCSVRDGWTVSTTNGRHGKRNLLRLIDASIHSASTIIAGIRPPPEPPSGVERGARFQEFYFSSLDFFMFRFFFGFLRCYGCAFSGKKTLEPRTGDEKFDLQIIGSVKPKAGSSNLIASTGVIDSKSGSRTDD